MQPEMKKSFLHYICKLKKNVFLQFQNNESKQKSEFRLFYAAMHIHFLTKLTRNVQLNSSAETKINYCTNKKIILITFLVQVFGQDAFSHFGCKQFQVSCSHSRDFIINFVNLAHQRF
jgi:hypothetical protein